MPRMECPRCQQQVATTATAEGPKPMKHYLIGTNEECRGDAALDKGAAWQSGS